MIFRKAEEVIQSMNGYPTDVKVSELRKLQLKHGDYDINLLLEANWADFENDKLIGMCLVNNVKMDKEFYNKILTFGRENGLSVRDSFLWGPNGKIQGYISDSSFFASTPELFEAIGKLYGLKTE